jgi:hypothetical protein
MGLHCLSGIQNLLLTSCLTASGSIVVPVLQLLLGLLHLIFPGETVESVD